MVLDKGLRRTHVAETQSVNNSFSPLWPEVVLWDGAAERLIETQMLCDGKALFSKQVHWLILSQAAGISFAVFTLFVGAECSPCGGNMF